MNSVFLRTCAQGWMLTGLLAISPALAQNAPLPSPSATPESEAEVIALLAKDLATLVRSPKKDFTLFHYNPKKSTGLGPQNSLHSPEALDYVRSKAERFWKDKGVGTSGSMMGDGLYLASDPISTVGYGQGADFALIEVRIKQDATILDLTAGGAGHIELSQKTRDALKAAKCHSGSYSSTQFYNLQSDPICQKFLNPALRALGVEVLAYSYGQSLIKDCHSKQVAFVLIDPRSIDQSQVSALSGDSDLSDPDAKAEIQMLHKLQKEEGSRSMGYMYPNSFSKWDKPEITAFASEAGSDEKLLKWKRKHLPFCDSEEESKKGLFARVFKKKQSKRQLSSYSYINFTFDGTKDLKDQSDDKVIAAAVSNTPVIMKEIQLMGSVQSRGCPGRSLIRDAAVEFTTEGYSADGSKTTSVNTTPLAYCQGLSVCVFDMGYLGGTLYNSRNSQVTWKCEPEQIQKSLKFAYDPTGTFTLRCP